MRILVTGGAGFLGRHVTRTLAARGEAVTVLDDLSCVNSTFRTPELQSDRIRCLEGSTLDAALVERLVRENDAILHMASVVGVEETMRNPHATVRNLDGTLNVVRATRRAQVLLFTSSADVYGLHSHLHARAMREDDLQVFEQSAVNRWIYPKVKSLEENLVLNAPARSIVVRVFNSFGPGMDYPHGKRMVPQFVSRILSRLPLRVSGSGRQKRALCYVTDTVRGLLLAMQHALDGDAAPTTLNIGASETWTVLDIARKLVELAVQAGIVEAPLPILVGARLYSCDFDDTWHRTPDLTRAARLLGYAPRVSVEDGLRHTLAYYAASREAACTKPTF